MPSIRQSHRNLIFSPRLLTAIALSLLLPACLADIRPDALKQQGYSAANQAAGRELLRTAMQAHGLSRYTKLDTISLTIKDTWYGIGTWATPYSANPQRYRHDLIPGTFSSRITLLDGPDAGKIMGMQNWRTFQAPTTDAAIQFQENDDIYFLLPTLQYFAEFAFRIDAAGLISSAGTIQHGGRLYDLVFATWGDGQPGTDADQYLIWIDRETRLIAKLRYTVRESARFLSGTMHYQDYRPVQPGKGALLFPFRQTVALSPPEEIQTEAELRDDALHEMLIESVELDARPRAEILGDPNAPAGGDYKP